MGYDGAQAVKAAAEPLSAPGKKYSFRKGEWLNLDGKNVMIHGGLPSGAHRDSVHPHTAWGCLAAAAIVRDRQTGWNVSGRRGRFSPRRGCSGGWCDLRGRRTAVSWFGASAARVL